MSPASTVSRECSEDLTGLAGGEYLCARGWESAIKHCALICF
jgi:hypothetical protein